MTKKTISRTLIFIVISSILSLLVGWVVNQFNIDFRFFLYLLLFLVAMGIILLSGKRALWFGFVGWIWMFILGFRTIYITSYYKLHPLIVFLGLLFAILLFEVKDERNVHLRLPRLLWVFSVFWFWGFAIGAFRGLLWSQMIADALNFFFLFPLFWIILYLSRNPRFWKTATQTFLMVGVIICLLGIIEFFVPAFRTQTLGLIQTETKGLNSFYGITRASFSFYGTPAAVVISSLCLPMASLIPKFYKGFWGKALAIICVVILGVGIYISGIRAAWLMIVVTSILLAYFKIGILGVGLTGGFWYIVSRFLPSEAWSLILTLANPLSTGKILDTSLQKRVWRQQYAFRLIQKYPLGVGWSGSGWVHGDFTQVTANLGILAGILFLAWYLHTLYRGWKYNRKSPKDWLFKAIFTSFILCGIVLAVEGVQVLTQFIMPVWFVWGLMEAYMQQKKTVNILSTGDK